MDCYFRQYWRDTRLRFQGPMKTLSLSIKVKRNYSIKNTKIMKIEILIWKTKIISSINLQMLDKIWKPDSTFFNGKHSYVHTITVPNKLLRLTQEGDILYSMRRVISFKLRANVSK